MVIKNALKKSMRLRYRRLSRGRKMLRLLGTARDKTVDFELIADTIQKSQGMYDVECSVCGFIGFFKAFGSPPR